MGSKQKCHVTASRNPPKRRASLYHLFFPVSPSSCLEFSLIDGVEQPSYKGSMYGEASRQREEQPKCLWMDEWIKK